MNGILACVAASRAPVLTIQPPASGDPYLIDRVIKLADDLADIRVPIFLVLYPDPGLHGYESVRYRQFFRYAYGVIKRQAPHAAVVWSSRGENPEDCGLYYPGNDVVDWVGVSLVNGVSEGGYQLNMAEALSYYVYTFQKDKPVMITALAVSHYSDQDHTYYVEQARDELGKVYAAMTTFPRVKAVIYAADGGACNDGATDDFSLADDDSLLAAYQQAVAGDSFLAALPEERQGTLAGQWLTSPFCAYLSAGQTYLDIDIFIYDLGIRGVTAERDISGRPVRNSTALTKYGTKKIDETVVNGKKIITIGLS